MGAMITMKDIRMLVSGIVEHASRCVAIPGYSGMRCWKNAENIYSCTIWSKIITIFSLIHLPTVDKKYFP
jgi:hypothetical protein